MTEHATESRQEAPPVRPETAEGPELADQSPLLAPRDDAPGAGDSPEGDTPNDGEETAAGENGAAKPADADEILEALRDVVDPELGINVVDLGLVYGVDLGEDGVATIDMTLTSAACPLTDVIEDQAAEALDGLVRSFRINWVWMPPWGPDKITEDGREQLRALGFNV